MRVFLVIMIVAVVVLVFVLARRRSSESGRGYDTSGEGLDAARRRAQNDADRFGGTGGGSPPGI